MQQKENKPKQNTLKSPPYFPNILRKMFISKPQNYLDVYILWKVVRKVDFKIHATIFLCFFYTYTLRRNTVISGKQCPFSIACSCFKEERIRLCK